MIFLRRKSQDDKIFPLFDRDGRVARPHTCPAMRLVHDLKHHSRSLGSACLGGSVQPPFKLGCSWNTTP